MGLALFYHLTRSPLEAAMPMILSRAVGQGWRVVVRGTDAERMAWLDERLWLGPEEGFLPHGLAGGPHDDLVEGAEVAPAECAGRERVWILFDGNDAAAVARARELWSALTGAGVKAQYWSEESGRWAMKTER
jgi:DNA polymerase-3 subunit chi